MLSLIPLGILAVLATYFGMQAAAAEKNRDRDFSEYQNMHAMKWFFIGAAVAYLLIGSWNKW